MTKEELKEKLEKGFSIAEILPLRNGVECTIFKATQFVADDTISYIPDCEMNGVRFEAYLATEDIDIIMEKVYSGQDILAICGGDEAKAKDVWEYVNWQHPSTAYDEMCENGWWDDNFDDEIAIPADKIISVLAIFRKQNKGDDATECLIDSICAELLDISSEEAFALLSEEDNKCI